MSLPPRLRLSLFTKNPREAHFFAAAGRRGGGLKFGRRSDNAFSLQRSFLYVLHSSSATKFALPAPCSALTSATRAAALSATGYMLFAPGRVFAQRDCQLARVAAATATPFPVYMKSREAHFLAAAGPRGGRRRGRLNFGRRSDSLFSLQRSFLYVPHSHFRRRARRSLPPGRCFRQVLVPRSPARPPFRAAYKVSIGCP